MEYINHRLGIKKGLKTLVISLVIFAIIAFIIQGIIKLIPVAIVLWAIFKGVKFIKTKFLNLKKDKVSIKTRKAADVENYKGNFEFMDNSNIIDVEYQQVNK